MKIIYFLMIFVWSSIAHASPPCGIFYEVIDASPKMERDLQKQSNVTYVNGEELTEVHIMLPNELMGARVGVLSLELDVRGKPNLVVPVEPYYQSSSDSSFLISVHQDLKAQLKLSAVYNFHEKCRTEDVASQGFRYHLVKP